ncbi:MAG: S8 family serine peptidase [Planctomycetota bacterium]
MRMAHACIAIMVAVVGTSTSIASAQIAADRGAADRGGWKNPQAPAIGAERAAATATLQASRVLAGRDNARVLVRFGSTPTASERAALEARGVKLLAPLGEGAFFANVSRQALGRAGGLEAAGVDLVEAIRPEWKLHPLLSADDVPEHALVETMPDREGRLIQRIAGYVVLHRDADLQEQADRLMNEYDVRVVDYLESVNGLVIEAPRDAARKLAALDEVQWMEPALPKFSTNNLANQQRTQADIAQSGAYGLDGSGVTVFVYDGGRADNHPDFQGRLTYIDNDGISNHPTHVAGTIGANGTHPGMAPAVQLLSAGFNFDGSGTFLYSNPGDLETDYAAAIAAGAEISNNSIGTNTAPNGFPCSITGDYGVTASVIDAVVRGSAGEPIIVFWSNGNERQTDRCGQTFATTAPPSTAKNHNTIGALNSNDDSVTTFTSWGPTDDGRLKPDFSAPGCQSNSDFGVTSTGSGGIYSTLCGTSMSSPTAAGCAALLLQDWRAQFPGAGDPLNATVKALFAHTAADVQNPGPDYRTGYGSIRVVDAIDHMRLARFDQTSAGQGESVRYAITVAAGEAVKVTAAWDDAPAVPNTFKALVNDLDVQVTAPDGSVFFPWTLAPDSPSLNATRDKPNRLDNIEQVSFTAGAAGTYIVEVFGYEVPEGPQSVSVVASHDLTELVGLDVLTPIPSMVEPGVAVDFEITMGSESIVPGTAQLLWAPNGGSFSSVALADLGGGVFGGALPGQFCNGGPVEFYFQAEGVASGLLTQPPAGASAPFASEVGLAVELLSDDFSADTGWTVGAPGDGATTGVWERATPQATEAQPGGAFSPPLAWVTEAAAGGGQGSFDVDGGATTLTSPDFDLSTAVDPVLSYQRWYSNTTGGSPASDTFRVELSDNGGASWTQADFVGPAGRGTNGGWFESSVRIADTVALTDQVRVRFIAEDIGGGSIVEAAIDDVVINDVVCTLVQPDVCDPDITTDGVPNGVPDGLVTLSDFSFYLSLWSNADAAADVTVDGVCDYGNGGDGVTLSDFSCYLSTWSAGCP